MSWQLLCQWLSSHVCQRGCFSNCIQNAKLVVFAVYIAPFLSQSILASLVNRTLFPWCLWKFCNRVDFMSAFIPAETTKGGGGGFTVYMRKLAPAPVSYRGDFLILYRVYMMMGHFMSRLFEGTLHVDKIPMRLKIAKIAHAIKNRKDCACATRSSPPADRFHTEMGGSFVFTWYRYEISYRCEILALVQQPGWTHAGVTRAGMTLCIM